VDRSWRCAGRTREASSKRSEAKKERTTRAARVTGHTPAATGDRRRFIRPPLLPRLAEDNPAIRPQASRRYQSGREFDDALVEQLDAPPEFVSACGFRNAKAPGFEADDFLAAAAAAEEKRGTTLIASGDRDTFQLASERTTILYPVRGQGMARIDPAEVRARYGVDPAQVPDFIALRGDPSDKLPGAPGVGAAGAATLLERYGSLEAALKAGRFPTQAESLRLYRSIATMNKAPLPILHNQKPHG
jgi:DNA polymerase-1